MSISPGSETADRRTELGTTRGVGQLVPVDPATRATIRILIVDDERTLRESCASALAVDGYNATVCGRGEEAQELLVRRAAHAVVVARETRAQHAKGGAPAGKPEELSLLGNAPRFREAISLARRVAATDASVFITGESGSGKEIIAQFIHQHSRRASRQMVAINCAALPETLLESEMFGHVKGAFTGAVRDKPGLLETANGGTMFLDELIEMPNPIQAKLLRVFKDGVVVRGGGGSTDAIVNVRFIAATNRHPEYALRSGMLREDLYYRLHVVPIPVPALS